MAQLEKSRFVVVDGWPCGMNSIGWAGVGCYDWRLGVATVACGTWKRPHIRNPFLAKLQLHTTYPDLLRYVVRL